MSSQGTPAPTGYFVRTGGSTFAPTEHVGGAWDLRTQHVAPALGLVAHCVELDRDARRDDGLLLSRLSYDILGTLPLEEVEVRVSVVRPGRTIELVEAALSHDGRDAVLLRAWLLRPHDTAALAASGHERLEPPQDMEPWEATGLWAGGFIASAEVRRRPVAPGRGSCWVRTDQPLVAGEDVSRLASTVGLLDIANGMNVLADPTQVAFPNVDLTAHLLREPVGEWLGLDTTVSFGPQGLGVTSSVVHDEHGPLGTLAQSLTVRPG